MVIKPINEVKETLHSTDLKENIESVKADIETLYQYWLLDMYADEIHTSEDHLRYTEQRMYYDLFLKELVEVEE